MVWRKGNPPTQLVGMQAAAAIMEISTVVAYKTKNRVTILFSNPNSWACIQKR